MGSLLLVPGLDTRLARILLERRRVEYPTLHAALTKVRALRQSAPHTLAQELVALGLVEASDIEATIASLLGEEATRAHLGPEGAGQRPWAPGRVTAGLEVLGSLGAGGMGEVLLARDTETGSEVAVKTLRLDEDPELLARFQREAEAQARVDAHPNVVRIHRSGVAEGRAFLVMDAVRGGDLAQRLARGPLEPRAAAHLVRDLARGLGYAHARGVLHRDLKPANVLFDERGTPRLADFGLARLLEAEALTQTGQILGTPSFMAPEQAQSDPQDERTDVYGLGGILYAALTGVPPFAGATVYALLEQVLSAPAPDPRARAPKVPAELAAICARCLEKSPGDRYASAADLGEALEGYLAGRAERPSTLRWGLLASGALLVVAALGAALAQRASSSPSPSPPARAQAPAPTPSPGSPLSEDEVRRRVQAAGEGLEGALLAERFLAEGRGPVPYLEARATKPFLRVRVNEISGAIPLAGGQLFAWRGAPEIGGPPVAWLLDADTGEVLREWNERFLDYSEALDRCAFLTAKGTVRFVDSRTWEEVGQSAPVAIVGAHFGGDAFWIVGRQGLGRIALDSPGQVTLVWAPPSGQDVASVLKLSSGDLLVASGRAEKSLVRLRLISPEGEVRWETPRQGIFDGKPRALEVSPNERWVLFGTASGQIALFDTAPTPGGVRSEVRTYLQPVSGDRPTAAAIAPRAQRATVALTWLSDETFLSLDTMPPAIHLWSREGACLARELGRELAPRRVSLSKDGRLCYVASEQKGLLSGVLRSSLLRVPN